METRFRMTQVRVFHAIFGGSAMSVYIGNRLIAEGISYSDVSASVKLQSGIRCVTVVDKISGEVILSEDHMFYAGDSAVLVLVNMMEKVQLVSLCDPVCLRGKNKAAFYLSNFSFGEGPFDVFVKDCDFVAEALYPKETKGAFCAKAGKYTFCVSKSYGEDRSCVQETEICFEEEKTYYVCIIGSEVCENNLGLCIFEA